MSKVPIKKYYILASSGSSKVYNIVDYSAATMKAHEVENNVYEFFISQMKALYNTISQGRNEWNIVKYIVDELTKKDFLLVKYPDNNFPTFYTSDGFLCINLSVIPVSYVSLSNVDIAIFLSYSFLNRFAMQLALSNKVSSYENLVGEMLYSLVIKMFRKKEGLSGRVNILATIRFLSYLYVYVSIFGYEMNEQTMARISSIISYQLSPGININYDFSSPIGYISCLSDNGIISWSPYVFVSNIVSRFDPYAYSIFEDVTRFIPVMYISSANRGSIFSNAWKNVRKDIVDESNRNTMFLLKRELGIQGFV